MASRSATAIRFPPELHERLKTTAKEHGLPINFLVCKAVEELLDNILPPSEIRWTHRRASS